MLRSAAVLIASVGMVASAQAAPDFSWENTPDGFAAGSNVTLSGYSTTTGVTDGTYSLSVNVNLPAAQWQLAFLANNGSGPTLGLRDEWAGKQVAFDLTTTHTDVGVTYLIQGDVDGPGPGGFVSQNLTSTVLANASSPDGSLTTTTVVFDFSTWAAYTGPVEGWSEIRIYFRKLDWSIPEPASYTVYMDNFRVLVPEPASLGLLSLGALIALRRRG